MQENTFHCHSAQNTLRLSLQVEASDLSTG